MIFSIDYVKHGLDVQETNLRSGMLPTNPGYGIEDYKHSGVFTNSNLESFNISSIAGNYCLYYQQIYQCLISQQNHPLPVIATDALSVIKLIELAELSNQQKQIIYLT